MPELMIYELRPSSRSLMCLEGSIRGSWPEQNPWSSSWCEPEPMLSEREHPTGLCADKLAALELTKTGNLRKGERGSDRTSIRSGRK